MFLCMFVECVLISKLSRCAYMHTAVRARVRVCVCARARGIYVYALAAEEALCSVELHVIPAKTPSLFEFVCD